MRPPKEVKVISSPASDYWFDEEGILWAVTKKVEDRSLEERRAQVESFKKELGNKKICMIIDITESSPLTREAQHFNVEHYPKIFKAIAFISRSAFSRMLGHLYLGMHGTPLPYKIFSNEEDALKWIRQFQ
jgi:hypothetical protein